MKECNDASLLLYFNTRGTDTLQDKIALPERYEITRRSFSQTVGRTIRATKIPNKCLESR